VRGRARELFYKYIRANSLALSIRQPTHPPTRTEVVRRSAAELEVRFREYPPVEQGGVPLPRENAICDATGDGRRFLPHPRSHLRIEMAVTCLDAHFTAQGHTRIPVGFSSITT